MRYRIRFDEEAQRASRHLPGHVRQRIARLIESLAGDPRPSEARELREHPGYYRVRLDDWRVVYRVDDDVLMVLVVRVGRKHGPEFYEELPE